jgi:hypothetical protein
VEVTLGSASRDVEQWRPELRAGKRKNWTEPTSSVWGAATHIGDLNGDGISDITWTRTVGAPISTPPFSKAVYIADRWIMNRGSTTPAWTYSTQSDTHYVVGVGDFARFAYDHDGIGDIVWRRNDGHINVWKMGFWGQVRESYAEPMRISGDKTLTAFVNLGPHAPYNNSTRPMSDYYCGRANGTFRTTGFSEPTNWWWSWTLDSGRGNLFYGGAF